MQRIGGSKVFVLGSGQPLKRILDLGGEYAAAAYRHRGNWYLITRPEIVELRRKWRSGANPEGLLRGRGKVATVTLGAKPSRPAVVLDAAGQVSGVWIAEAGKRVAGKASPKPLRGRPRRRDTTLSDAGESPSIEVHNVSSGDISGDIVIGGGGGSGTGGPPPGDSPEDGPETVRRTPHLDAPEEIAKAPGSEFTVSAYVDTKELRAGEAGEGIELDLPPEVDAIDVGVLLQLTGPFELAEGSEFRTLTIARDEEESAKLEFKLRVTATEEGPAAISALFTLRGRSCGHVARVWDWATKADKAPCLDAGAEAPVSMPLHVRGDQSDLSIFITAPIKDGVHYQCAVQAPALEGYEQPSKSEEFALPADAYEFMQSLLTALVDEDNRTPEQRFRSLREIGHKAWEAAPEIVRDVLWKMVDAKVPPKTINIASAEPLLPWELMIPRRFGGEEPARLGPLGVEFAIGRWTRVDGQAPSPTLRVSRSFVIAPTYPGKRQLDFEAELQLIENELCGHHVKPATVDDLDQRFGKDHATLLHFVCHGGTGDQHDDVIALDAEEPLRAGEMETLEGFEDLCGTTHPLVFLNSCSTGQMVPSLAGGAGFPRSFGNLGANAIIAPLWPVDDGLASEVAVEIYKEALKPGAESIAEILRQIRRRGYEAKDVDTYAAYCFFGDPQARLELLDCAS